MTPVEHAVTHLPLLTLTPQLAHRWTIGAQVTLLSNSVRSPKDDEGVHVEHGDIVRVFEEASDDHGRRFLGVSQVHREPVDPSTEGDDARPSVFQLRKRQLVHVQ